ncbi:hypothetical protein CerSpe_157630 [Prunus speciosa]
MPGNFYFLCGAPSHCQAGQRVEIMATLPTPNGSFVSPSPAPYGSSPSASHSEVSPSSDQSSGPAPHSEMMSPSSALRILFSKLGLGVTLFVLSSCILDMFILSRDANVLFNS